VSVRVNYLPAQRTAPISRGDGLRAADLPTRIYGRFLRATIHDNMNGL
jgi:hypothetical protein